MSLILNYPAELESELCQEQGYFNAINLKLQRSAYVIFKGPEEDNCDATNSPDI